MSELNKIYICLNVVPSLNSSWIKLVWGSIINDVNHIYIISNSTPFMSYHASFALVSSLAILFFMLVLLGGHLSWTLYLCKLHSLSACITTAFIWICNNYFRNLNDWWSSEKIRTRRDREKLLSDHCSTSKPPRPDPSPYFAWGH